MKFILIVILLFFTACSQDNKISEKEDSFEIMNRRISDIPSVVEREVTLGEAITLIIDDGKNRVDNIELACNAISGKTLNPGEEFSFNTITGDKTQQRGYKYAPVIFKGEKTYGIGGGVCQVSSTIYMAAVNAGLEITEKHSHSESVAYAPNHTDATVVYGEKDFKFVNDTGDVIYIYTWVTDGKVFSKIIKKSIDIE